MAYTDILNNSSECFEIAITPISNSIASAAVVIKRCLTAEVIEGGKCEADIQASEQTLITKVVGTRGDITASISVVCTSNIKRRYVRYKTTDGYYKLNDNKYYSVIWMR